MKRIGRALFNSIAGAAITFVVVLIVSQNPNMAIGPGIAAFVLFFFYGLATGKSWFLAVTKGDDAVPWRGSENTLSELKDSRQWSQLEDLQFFEIAAGEVENDTVNKGVWAMASVKAGTTSKPEVIPLYVQLRVEQLKSESLSSSNSENSNNFIETEKDDEVGWNSIRRNRLSSKEQIKDDIKGFITAIIVIIILLWLSMNVHI